MPWDFAAGMVIVREAGGVLTHPDGTELGIATGAVRGANGPEMLRELRRVLGELG
jgi:fructose-1,6-bisphosphatase/inositol monophosphatase family enzyme